MSRFINTELKSDSESSDSDLESEKIGAKVDNKLEKAGSDSEWDILLINYSQITQIRRWINDRI